MAQINTAVMEGSIGVTTRRSPRFGATLAALWQSLMKDFRDPYRPEQHYMRGPGPKWRAKHGR
jgi:hypothetical protein